MYPAKAISIPARVGVPSERIFVDNDDEIRVVFYKLNMYNYAYPQEEKECMNMKHLTTKKMVTMVSFPSFTV